MPADAQAQVARATEDLSRRLGVPQSDVRVVSVEGREWSDASLGCPEPGVAYIQVITPGYLIILEAGGKRYEYHTAKSRAVLCEGGKPVK